MKIAITGKGGAGKTTIAGALSRQFARAGHRVVAVDADPNPNLGISLGLSPDAVVEMQPILNALLASGHTHNDPAPDPEDLLSRFGVGAPDGVTVVATGKLERPTDSCLCCGSHMTTQAFFGGLADTDRVVVADLEAGLGDLAWTRPGAGDVVLVVSDGSAKAMDVAVRSVDLARQMGVTRILGVANRARGDQDAAALGEALGVETISVPEDPALERADHLAVAAMDMADRSPGMVAVAGLAARLAPPRVAGPAR